MVVTFLTTCVVIWLIRTIYILRFRGFRPGILAWDQAPHAQSGKKTHKKSVSESLGEQPLSLPQSTAWLSSFSDFLFMSFHSVFCHFSHIGAFSYEVACVSGHPKGLRERRFLWGKKSQSCRVTSFSLNHIISACASGRFLWRLSSVWGTQFWSKILRSFRSRRTFLSPFLSFSQDGKYPQLRSSSSTWVKATTLSWEKRFQN